MARLFLAVALPPPVAEHVSLLGGGIPGARWEPPEKLHLTLQFLGDVEGLQRRELDDALSGLQSPPFDLTLAGVGHFPPRGQPRSLWVGVDDPKPVSELHRRLDRLIAAVGFEPDRRKFSPHVTIARLKGSPEGRVAEFIAHHALFRSVTFPVEHVTLFSSVLHRSGSKYLVEREVRLWQA